MAKVPMVISPVYVPSERQQDIHKVMLVAGAGAAVGKGLVMLKGASAVGVLTVKGAGMGAAAGPVGMALGATIAVAGYGMYKLLSD